MLIPKKGEQVAHDSITAAVIRGMKSSQIEEKPRTSSGASFQVGTDSITREVMRSMRPPQNRIRSSAQPDGNKSYQFLMCDYLR